MSLPLFILAIIAALLALLPALVFIGNWSRYRRTMASSDAGPVPGVAILIPARNEELSIADAVTAALASSGVDLEVIVLDDHSDDRTADIVRDLAGKDQRLRVASAPPLPAGWCGKQHACHILSTLATKDVLIFIDADVRLAPDAAARAIAFMNESQSDLVSGIPRQQTGTLLEKLLIPLIHFFLLGFLPIGRMRASTDPAYGAGCGQWFIARRDSYRKADGHAAIRQSLHDGIQLPRAFRRAGLRTDLFDATDVASCRMYRSAGEVWRGLEKNATEGMAGPAAIVPWTFVLFLGQVFPIVLLVYLLPRGHFDHRGTIAATLCAIAALASYAVRAASAVRFRQSWLGVALHPVGVLLLLAIQWSAFLRNLTGRPAQWRGRTYAPQRPESRNCSKRRPCSTEAPLAVPDESEH